MIGGANSPARARSRTLTFLIVSVLLVSALASIITPRAFAIGPSVVATVGVGSGPSGVAYDSGKGEVFVANINDKTVSVIRDADNAVVALVSVGSVPQGVAYDSGKGEVFVTNEYDNTVSVISDADNTVVATVHVGSFESLTLGVAYDSGKGEVFVTNSLYHGTVSVISDADNTVVATVVVGAGPNGVAYDSGKGEVFVTNFDSSTVSVISDASDTVVATVGVGRAPLGVAYDSGKGEVFVANAYDNSVSVISDASNTVVAMALPSVGEFPIGVAYDSGKGEVFVTNIFDIRQLVSVISDADNTNMAPVSVGRHPLGVAYDCGKGEVFVANNLDNTVSVISDGGPTAPIAGVSISSPTGGSTFYTDFDLSLTSVPGLATIARISPQSSISIAVHVSYSNSGGAADGTLTLTDNSIAVGSLALSSFQGSASTTFSATLGAGSHTLKATLSLSNCGGSSSASSSVGVTVSSTISSLSSLSFTVSGPYTATYTGKLMHQVLVLPSGPVVGAGFLGPSPFLDSAPSFSSLALPTGVSYGEQLNVGEPISVQVTGPTPFSITVSVTANGYSHTSTLTFSS